MGLFADVYIGYVLRLFVYMFKTLAGGLRARGSASWQLANACLSSPGLADRGFWACPTAEITYTYRYNGELYSDIYERPFLLLNSATEYALRFRVGDVIVVRIKPGKPDVSVVRDADQYVANTKIATTLFT